VVSPIIDSHDLFEAEQEVTRDQELVLKLPNLSLDQLPPVTIVTVTYNRKAIFPMAIRNWSLFDYPHDRLEWVIVDDSDDGSSLSSLLPNDTHICYYRLKTTGRLSIGQKRNFGVEHATHSIIVFMDDDDYYYPYSIHARVALLLKYPQYDLVGVTDLDIYDVVNDFSARVKGSLISEASMGFRKSFWQEQHFPDQFNSLGEGYPFTKNRRHKIIKMPSCFNMIAMTHRTNYTQGGRSYDRYKNVTKKDNLLHTLDFSTRLFITELFNQRGKSPLKTPLFRKGDD
jgi:glycosyltransferase involved in cell wall biosynthesis